MTAWEQEIGKEYLAQHWQKTLQLIYTSTKSANLWKLHNKRLLQWYLTPHCIYLKFIPTPPQSVVVSVVHLVP